MAEILASLDDINANLDGQVAKATEENTALIQISVARVVKGYLARIVDNVTLATWANPETTPDIIREVSGKLIASQLFINQTSQSSLEITDEHFGQRLYNEAIKILNGIIDGTIDIPVVIEVTTGELSSLDFFPVDDTDRAFSMGMEL